MKYQLKNSILIFLSFFILLFIVFFINQRILEEIKEIL